MKDRLNSLYRHSPRQAAEILDEAVDDLLFDNSISYETDSFLQEIFLHRQSVVELRHATDRVSQLHRLLLAALDATGPDFDSQKYLDSVNEMVKTLDKEFEQIDKTSTMICKGINDLKSLIGQTNGGAAYRIRKDQLMGLTESFRLILIKFNKSYVRYEEESRRRALEYAKKTQIMETEEERVLDFYGSEPITSRPQLVRTISAFDIVLQEVKDRHHTIERMEKSIEDLGRLFCELKVYVECASDLTNDIEKNIEKAGEYVEKSQMETAMTAKNKKDMEKGRGWMGRSVRYLRHLIVFLVLFLFFLFFILFWLFLHFAVAELYDSLCTLKVEGCSALDQLVCKMLRDRRASLVRASLLKISPWKSVETEKNSNISCDTYEYLDRINIQKSEVKKFKQAVRYVSSIHKLLVDGLNGEPKVEAVQEAINRLDVKIPEVDSQGGAICKAIIELRKDILLRCSTQIELDIRKNQLTSLSTTFKDIMNRFSQDYIDYNEESRLNTVNYAKFYEIDEDGWIKLVRTTSTSVNASLKQEEEPLARMRCNN